MSAAVTVLLQPARVIVDPNSAVRGAPELTSALFDDADRVPQVGEVVIASQPDPDGSDFVGSAVVERIDREHRLIFLRVDWASFREVRPRTVTVGSAGSGRPRASREVGARPPAAAGGPRFPHPVTSNGTTRGTIRGMRVPTPVGA